MKSDENVNPFLNKYKWLKHCTVHFPVTLLAWRLNDQIKISCAMLRVTFNYRLMSVAVFNVPLLLPPSGGSGDKHRLSCQALLHEQHLEEHSQQEEQQEEEEEVETWRQLREERRTEENLPKCGTSLCSCKHLPNITSLNISNNSHTAYRWPNCILKTVRTFLAHPHVHSFLMLN